MHDSRTECGRVCFMQGLEGNGPCGSRLHGMRCAHVQVEGSTHSRGAIRRPDLAAPDRLSGAAIAWRMRRIRLPRALARAEPARASRVQPRSSVRDSTFHTPQPGRGCGGGVATARGGPLGCHGVSTVAHGSTFCDGVRPCEHIVVRDAALRQGQGSSARSRAGLVAQGPGSAARRPTHRHKTS